MTFYYNISVLSGNEDFSTKIDKLCINSTWTVKEELTEIKFGGLNRDAIPYYLGLVKSMWDSSTFYQVNDDFPKFVIPDSVTVKTTVNTRKLLSCYQEIQKLSYYDKKKNNILTKAKSHVCNKILDDVSAEYGCFWLGSSKLKEVLGQDFDKIEKHILDYLINCRQWATDKAEQKKEKELEAKEFDNVKRNAAIEVLVQNGLNRDVLIHLTTDVLIENVSNILIEKYKAEHNEEFNFGEKQYDDGGRYCYYVECYFDRTQFKCYPEKSYY